MSRDIRDFMNKNYTSSSSNTPNITPDMQKSVDNYSKMNESQLMSEMAKMAAQGKSSGSLTAESLQAFYNQVAPMLSSEQAGKLRQLIKSLK